ncbi:C4b-binding protein alpha chain [Trichosurus vulpecula]|uniref:C4b-binding protein alpha chain n=1 Tax=Trichosurus vulpecula TaxID=9337 RepID=UPI00186AFFD4|nr:C4b-binding protein alpha chain [Trichosurus vulpecula]XP_036609754.1 C4b-binding protein alpha chain [Trichosurus vulpecula]
MAYRREKWKGYGPTLFQIILSFALLTRVHGFCEPPPRLTYAFPELPLEIVNQTTFSEGAQVTYTCHSGYTRSASKTTLTCVKNSWYPTTPFCVKKRCRHPGELNNGRVIVKTNLEFGSKIEFSCLDGYKLVGSSTSRCEIFDSGVDWSDPLPECEIVVCSPPPHISNGKHSSREDDTYNFGSSVTYRCNTPFSLIGEASLSCTVVNGTIGVWSPQPPTCKMVTCKQPQFPNGKFTSGFGPTYTYKNTILLECNEGYILNGTNVIHCEADNQWHPDIPTCVINACIERPLIENAYLVTRTRGESVFPVGSVLTFACKRGYKAIPDALLTATCQEDFSWHMNEGFCEKICCPTPVIDGKILRFNNDCRYLAGSSISYYCKSSRRESKCQENGTWRPEISSCEKEEKDVCTSPKAIANGNYTKTYSAWYNNEVHVDYTCNDGYVLIGKAKITCKNSKWSHPFPQCQALCPKPEISNGKLSSEKIQYRGNENAEVQCSPGYYLVGPQIITCSENKSWIPEVPKCEWEFPEGCEKVSAGYKLMQCLPNAQDVKLALEIHKLSLEIEMLELEISKKRDTYQSHHHHHVLHKIEKDPQTHTDD